MFEKLRRKAVHLLFGDWHPVLRPLQVFVVVPFVLGWWLLSALRDLVEYVKIRAN